MNAVRKHTKWFSLGLLCFVCFLAAVFHGKPRTWAVGEAPVAFWAWHTEAPDQLDIRAAVEKANARAVFLRAGQIDYQNGKLRRIRPLVGSLPKGIKLHLVYNATRAVLDQFETVDPNALATEIARAYKDDAQRAERDGADLSGLQLDIDVPTRLLPRYEQTLKTLRQNIEPGKQLSITGLPTWMESSALNAVLERVDFWIPQFYGVELPTRSDQMIPISSPENVTQFVNRARKVGKPFYAGLAAYTVVLLYDPSGSLVTLRGDMDPGSIAADPNLELTGRHSFDNRENRYTFRVRADGVTDGLNLHAGDVLVVHVPNAESLRIAARITRELAGEKLLGLCVFRLPERDDPATLTVDEVTSALADRDQTARVDVHITAAAQRKLILEFKNAGTAQAMVGTLKTDVAIPAGSFESANSDSGVVIDTMCPEAGSVTALPQRCSSRRASLIRLTPRLLAPGQTFQATLVLNREPPPTLNVNITMQTDADQPYVDRREISIDAGVK